MGYLPEALINYLVRLGWSHGDQEIFARDELVSVFSLDPIGRAPARLDFDKLDNVNAHYIRETDDQELATTLERSFDKSWLEVAHPPEFNDINRARLVRAMPALKERAKTLLDLTDKAGFLFKERPIDCDAKAAKMLSDEGRAHLAAILPRFEALDSWTVTSVEDVVRGYADDQGIGLGKIAQPLRAALTGTPNSPGIFDCLFALGRDESLARIADQSAVITG